LNTTDCAASTSNSGALASAATVSRGVVTVSVLLFFF
jgi:hypothetical protein